VEGEALGPEPPGMWLLRGGQWWEEVWEGTPMWKGFWGMLALRPEKGITIEM